MRREGDKARAFFENAHLLSETFGMVPLMYGSVGLEYLTGENLGADDVDILIPEVFLKQRWTEFRACLEAQGYRLTDAHEHEFEKDGIRCAYASIEELETFAQIPLGEIAAHREGDVSFRLLTIEQYLRVYRASVRDGYRIHVREKKDGQKIALIGRLLSKERGKAQV